MISMKNIMINLLMQTKEIPQQDNNQRQNFLVRNEAVLCCG